jgi:hypothetical protein
MATVLTKEEKIDIVNQHIRALDYAIYNAELDKMEAEALANPEAGVLSALTERLANLNSKRSVLTTELETISE